MTTIELNILGSGTSTGIPMLGCDCETCTSDDPQDRRFRSSLLLRWRDTVVVIDTTPEFRLQMLRARCQTLDAVLLTHCHADHVAGLDDVRPFSFGNSRPIPIYGNAETLNSIKKRFDYVWNAPQIGGGLPKIELRPVTEPFVIDQVEIVPVPVQHGIISIYGYRVGNMAYISDVSGIPESSMALLQGVEILIVDAVRYRPHATHFHLEAAIEASRAIGAKQTYFTHLNHDFLHRRLAAELPAGMAPAYDGLLLEAHAPRPEIRINLRANPFGNKELGKSDSNF